MINTNNDTQSNIFTQGKWKGELLMKKWMEPEVEVLDMECTEYGKKYSQHYDEVRVDQHNNTWYSFSAGNDFNGDLNGDVIKK